jgi:hypothetical protein
MLDDGNLAGSDNQPSFANVRSESIRFGDFVFHDADIGWLLEMKRAAAE